MVSEWLIETKVEYTGGREGGGGYAMLHLDHFFSKRGVNGEGGGVLYNTQTLQNIRATAFKSWKKSIFLILQLLCKIRNHVSYETTDYNLLVGNQSFCCFKAAFRGLHPLLTTFLPFLSMMQWCNFEKILYYHELSFITVTIDSLKVCCN